MNRVSVELGREASSLFERWPNLLTDPALTLGLSL